MHVQHINNGAWRVRQMRQKRLPVAHVAFGCRMMAFVSENSQSKASRNVRRFCLLNAPNALRKQSLPGRLPHDGIKRPFSQEELLGIYEKNGHTDGWGVAGLFADTVKTLWKRDITPAYREHSFKAAIDQVIKAMPPVVMAHLRMASSHCSRVCLENAHPFTYQGWAFMHNGEINSVFGEPLQHELVNEAVPALGAGPQGSTDTERAFYLLMGRLKRRFGTVASQVIGIDNLRSVFAQTIRDLLAHSQATYHPLVGNRMGISGRGRTGPSLNLVLSDGRVLLAFRHGGNLYLGRKPLGKNRYEYILASEYVPSRRGSRQPIQWAGIRENTLITMVPQSDGTMTVDLRPLETVL